MPLQFSAVVLAAGRSSRMGTDKAALLIEGEPAWWRQCRRLEAAGAAEVLLSARPEQPWVMEAMASGEFQARLSDPWPDRGPLGGIVAALEHARAEHVAVLAIDLPRMEADWFRQLAAASGPGSGAVGQMDGHFEPLAAIYPRKLLPSWRAALAGNDWALQPLVREAVQGGALRAIDIGESERGWFENRNV